MIGGLRRIPGQMFFVYAASRRRTARQPLGFTVVEVMIVLAVTGLLFVSAVTLISGKQNQAAFNQAIQQVRAQIQQVINEVSIGYYPNSANFQCTAGPLGPVLGAGTNEQGTNSGCIFVGKVIQFDVHGTNPEQFAVMPLAGLQQSSGKEVTSLATALPAVVANGITTMQLQSGLTSCTASVATGIGNCRMTFTDAVLGTVNIGAVAFVKSFAQYSGSDIVSGSQQVDLVPVGTSALNATQASTITAVNTRLKNAAFSPVDPTGGISLCFVSGGTQQSGLITIGSNGRQLSVELSIRSNTTCS